MKLKDNYYSQIDRDLKGDSGGLFEIGNYSCIGLARPVESMKVIGSTV
jgi:hypothetical protein